MAGTTKTPIRVHTHCRELLCNREPATVEILLAQGGQPNLDAAECSRSGSIRGWLPKYKAICDKYGTPPWGIYNYDGTGFRIGVGRNQWIITRISCNNPKSPKEKRSGVTNDHSISTSRLLKQSLDTGCVIDGDADDGQKRKEVFEAKGLATRDKVRPPKRVCWAELV